MHVTPLAIPDVKLVTPKRFSDSRGFFSETYNASAFALAGITTVFVQDNHAKSAAVGTLRGLHAQKPPVAQAKLVRCARGRILDVAVDARRASPTYGQVVTAELSAENWAQLFVPAGFLHGYITLEDNSEVLYKVDAPYAPDHEVGVIWNDPDLAIRWPLSSGGPHLSPKDHTWPHFKDLGSHF